MIVHPDIPDGRRGGNGLPGLLHFVQRQAKNVVSHFDSLAQGFRRGEAILQIREVDGIAAILLGKDCGIYILRHSLISFQVPGQAGVTRSPPPF